MQFVSFSTSLNLFNLILQLVSLKMKWIKVVCMLNDRGRNLCCKPHHLNQSKSHWFGLDDFLKTKRTKPNHILFVSQLTFMLKTEQTSIANPSDQTLLLQLFRSAYVKRKVSDSPPYPSKPCSSDVAKHGGGAMTSACPPQHDIDASLLCRLQISSISRRFWLC
jgi:hypothetical protein